MNGSGQTIGQIRLYWSSTCQANWGQAYFNDGNPASTPPVQIKVVGSTAGSSYDNGPVSFTYSGSGSPVWGNMVYSPGCSYATVTRGDAKGTAVQVGCSGPGGSGGGPPATKCSGMTCTGQDPNETVCSNDATTAGSAPIVDGGGQPVGQIELRWSPTCQANWGRAFFNDGNPPSAPPVDIQVVGSEGENTYDEAPVDFYTTGSGSPVWGNMVYSPGCAYATVTRGDVSGTAVQQGCPAPSSQPAPNVPYTLTSNGWDWTVPGGQDVNGVVANFTDPDPSATPGDFLVTIDWGDGTITGGSVSGDSNGFAVNGEHFYPDPTIPGVATAQGYDVYVTITDIGGGADGGGGSTTAEGSVEMVGNNAPVSQPPDGSSPGVSSGDKGWTIAWDGFKTFAENVGCGSGVEDLIGLLACPLAGASDVELGEAIADPPDSHYRHVFHARPLSLGKLRRHCFHLSTARCRELFRAELSYRAALLHTLTLTEDVGVTANRFGGAARARSRRFENLQRAAERKYYGALRRAVRAQHKAGHALGHLIQRFHVDRRISAQRVLLDRRRLLALKWVTPAYLRMLHRHGLPATRAALRAAVRRALRWVPAARDTTLSAVLGL